MDDMFYKCSRYVCIVFFTYVIYNEKECRVSGGIWELIAEPNSVFI